MKSERKHKIQSLECKVKIIKHKAMKTYGIGLVELQILVTKFYSVYAWKVHGGVEISIHKIWLLVLDETM